SRHHFYSAVLLLLVVMVMCCNTGGAAGEALAAQESSKGKSFVWRDKGEGDTVKSLRVPSLVEMNGDVFAVAEAQGTKKNEIEANTFTGTASELLTLTGEQTKKELDTNQMRTQLLEECSSDEGNCLTQNVAQANLQSQTKVLFIRPTTVVNGSEIYMLAGIYVSKGEFNANSDMSGANKWGLLLSRGNVSSDDGKSGNRIFWTGIDVLMSTSDIQEKASLAALISGGGSGVNMGDGTLVFPVQVSRKTTTKKEDGTEEIGDNISLMLYIWGKAGGKLSKEISDGGCSDPSLVKWKEDKLIMMTACDDGRRRVYESGDKGESWTEALGTLSRVWGNKQKGPEKGVVSGFTTATIDGVEDANKRDVMLITLPVYSKEQGIHLNRKGKLHLWLTDNTHIVDIGPVSGEDDATASSLLYKSGENDNNNEMIALYKKEKEGTGEATYGMVSVLLTAQLQQVKEVLATWKKVDERVFKLCSSFLAAKDASSGDACSANVKLTDGLVGFLSDNFSNDTWRDEYLGVNATVHNKERSQKADNGVKFTGRGAGAEWPVGRQGENQLYHFANYNFTLVATVSIDGEPTQEGPIPVMGVHLDGEGESKLMGLSYKKEKWELLCSDETSKELSSTLGAEKTQHVVMLVRNGTRGSAYVDGQRVGGDPRCALGNKEDQKISHFYIGGGGSSTDSTVSAGSEEGVSVTVTNVLLYNRPLDGNEITALNTNKLSNSKMAGLKTVAGGTRAPETSARATLGSGTQSATARPQLTEQEHLDGTTGASGDSSGQTDGQEKLEIHSQNKGVNFMALNSSQGNVSQENNSDAGTMRESGLPLLLLLLGLWGFAAL
ncbi:trans-sialidase, putative, partial [Trypanosoma cruzi marinkellei]